MRGKIIAAALAIVLVTVLTFLVCSTQRSGVLVRSVDKRLKIYGYQYFAGGSMDFSYPAPPPPPSKLRMQWTRLIHKLGFYVKAIIPSPVELRIAGKKGPALVVLGQIAGGDSHWLELVAQDGQTINQSAPMRALVSETNLFLWNFAFYSDGWKTRSEVYPLINGNYHLRFSGETNDLAVIRVR